MTTGRELHWNLSGRDVTVRIDESKGHGVFHLADRSIHYKILDRTSHSLSIEIDGVRRLFYILRKRGQFSVWHNGRTCHFSRVNKAGLGESEAVGASGDITALMPGKILRIEVSVGDAVEEKQTLATMESMKMETALQSPRSGRVAEIRCEPGRIVDMGEVLIVVE